MKGGGLRKREQSTGFKWSLRMMMVLVVVTVSSIKSCEEDQLLVFMDCLEWCLVPSKPY